ncbi:hypothetical protein BCY86_05405 [Pajaroellobacter abortibovis]|uniref:Uncharacterized protein n=1 Tax=Pajaroellobacter abortibovis TaxID=1882918 RepID=A0A1L6MXQ3_9BACT|nr:hypothetical protein BCY86_05405 [Pajaroellobacter abortibovis]
MSIQDDVERGKQTSVYINGVTKTMRNANNRDEASELSYENNTTQIGIGYQLSFFPKRFIAKLRTFRDALTSKQMQKLYESEKVAYGY